ncbi:hypothetical protein C8258_19615 [Nocardia sp. MDA0666]|uniref:MMPL family transporter n=1 Tax=Nocardia sp. MDA0666 TaxID=2135448 RepID=UPI000D1337F2|nr:MMPL family transporter [Nocardia sp. MDA0666]PSR66729.1 hypothetical protein C8258_19615 [Nocardia sp. MDA0666]
MKKTSVLERVARVAAFHPKVILGVALLVVLIAAAAGSSVVDRLEAGGFAPPDAESTRVSELVDAEFGGVAPNLVLTVGADGGVESPSARQAGVDVTAWLQRRSDITAVQSYWTSPPDLRAALRSSDGRTALVVARIAGDDTAQQKAADEIARALPAPAGVTIHAGGYAATLRDLSAVSVRDLASAEAVAIPISAIVLILVFGSVIAALLPVVIGLVSIVTTLAVLRLLTEFTEVSVFALNTTTALSLALAIDYSLFVVSRYREELDRGADREEAVIRAVCTAGRAVLYSALVVILSLSALLVFPMFFLRSFAYSGLVVVAVAALASVLVLPACLVLLGDRVNALDLRAPLRRLLRLSPRRTVPLEDGVWYRMVTGVMRRALPVAVVVTALLLLLGAPFLAIKFGTPDDRAIRAGVADSRTVGDILRSEFARNPTDSVTVVLPGHHGDPGAYAAELSRVPDVSAVLSGSGTYVGGARMASAPPGMSGTAGEVLLVGTDLDPYSVAGARQLDRLRAIAAPAPPLFGGAAAENRDALDSIGARLPVAAVWIVVAMFSVLFLFTGSVVLPVKALLMNVLSLTAAFGAMVWIFQDGHLAGVLGFTPTGYLVANVPIMMFCLAFGMSMDYEIFLLSRIREEWLRCGDNTRSVALGVARTGRIVTAAAALMAIVLGALVFSRLAFIQLLGLGLALTVLVDATVVRCLLVPSLMRLTGRWNWWAPRPLRWVHARVGLRDAEPVSG